MRKFAVVTTCHAAGYEQYGRRMVETFLKHWPAEVELYLYTEGFDPEIRDDRLIVQDLNESCPDLVAFKARHANNPRAHGKARRRRLRIKIDVYRKRIGLRGFKWGVGYRWDAVRFSHKAFAIFHAARHVSADVLIWIDADTRFFRDVGLDEIETFIPPKRFVGCLRRPFYHSECGFVAYNLRHPAIGRFFDRFERFYTQDLFLNEYEWHDSYLFDLARRATERRGARSWDIARGVGSKAKHVLLNSSLGEFMDHMKGERKKIGSSTVDDLIGDKHSAVPRG